MPAAIAGAVGTIAASAAGASAATAGLVGAGLSAAGTLASGLINSGNVGSAAGSANQISQATINAAQTAYAPYMSQGQNALTQYANLSGINGQDAANSAMAMFQGSPGYQYQVQQGLLGVDQGAAAQGTLRSGSTLKAEESLASNLANQNYSNYLGTLNTLAGYGLNSTNAYTNVLNGQSNNQQQTTTSAAGTQASINGNMTQGLVNQFTSPSVTNALSGLFTSNNNDPFGGSGGVNYGGGSVNYSGGGFGGPIS